MLPEKINAGDEIRVIAPARSASDIDEAVLARAQTALESLGLKVSFRPIRVFAFAARLPNGYRES